jgi:hypothetical protein
MLYSKLGRCNYALSRSPGGFWIAAFSFLLWLVAAIWVITFIVVGYRRRGRGVETNVERRGKEVEGQTNTASEAMAVGRMEDPIV